MGGADRAFVMAYYNQQDQSDKPPTRVFNMLCLSERC